MLKEKIKDFVDSMEVDVSELESARWDYNIYGVEPQYAVGGWDYDEDEEWEAQKEKAIDWIKSDGVGAYFNEVSEAAFERDAKTLRLTNAAIKYIESL